MAKFFVGMGFLLYFLGVVGMGTKAFSENWSLDEFLTDQFEESVSVASAWPIFQPSKWLD